MQIVIELPNEEYTKLQDGRISVSTMRKALLDGTVLSEPQEGDRAISLNAAIKAVRHAEVNFSVQSEIDFTKHKREVQEIIDNILDAQEKALRELPLVTPQRPTGHWIEPRNDDGMSDPIYYQIRCSKCNFDLDPQTFCEELKRYGGDKYCPRCGARMEVSE